MVVLVFMVVFLEFQKFVSFRMRGLNAMGRITRQAEKMKQANAAWERRHLLVMRDAPPPSVAAPRADAGA